jgi:hypothetical protein
LDISVIGYTLTHKYTYTGITVLSLVYTIYSPLLHAH